MSDSQRSDVFLAEGTDPEMLQTYREARATFRYFWREVNWERHRIVPALDLAYVKAPFSDGDRAARPGGTPNVEHMWIGEIDFDGRFVTGVLLNSPNWLGSVKAGDPARLPLDEISDWMYAISGVVYGAHTVNLLRSRMDARESASHDSAWGLKFGDPRRIRLVPSEQTDAPGGAESQEHPVDAAMAPSLKQRLAEDPSLARAKDDRGWTLLHRHSLAGSTATVKVLLEGGAEPNATTKDGMTPRQLAESLGWDRVVSLLVTGGTKK